MKSLDQEKLLLEIYRDVGQPIARPIGNTLGALVEGIVGVDVNKKRFEWLRANLLTKLAVKLNKKLREGRQINEEPRFNVALPILEALSLTDNEVLSDMFSELLAKELTIEESKGILPAFVQILKSLTPDEARILRLLSKGIVIDQKYILEKAKPSNGYIKLMPFVKVSWVQKDSESGEVSGGIILKNYSPPLYRLEVIHENIPAYIDNLISLGVITTSLDNSLMGVFTGGSIALLDYAIYIEDQPSYQEIISACKAKPGRDIELEHGHGKLTDFGYKFLDACGY